MEGGITLSIQKSGINGERESITIVRCSTSETDVNLNQRLSYMEEVFYGRPGENRTSY